MDLSIITINYKTPRLLQDSLQSLDKIRLANELDFEVVLVNVTPEDGSGIMVKKSFPWVKQIVDTRNLGFSGNNNIGIAESIGRYILFLNSDTTIPRRTLSEMIRFMDQQEEQKVGAATCYIELVSGGMDPDCHRGFPTPWASLTHFLGLEKLFPKLKLFGQYHQFYLPLDKTHQIDACAGAFLLLRREVGEQIDLRENPKSEALNPKQSQMTKIQNSKRFGHLKIWILNLFRISDFGFRVYGRHRRPLWWDEDFFFYGEDLDLCYRIKEAGYKIMFYPHVKITHHKGASSGIRKESKEITKASCETKRCIRRETTRAMRLFYQKHYEDKYLRIVTVLVYFGIAVIEKLRGLK